MKRANKVRFTAAMLAVALVAMIGAPSAAMAAPVPLGTTSSFAVLAGTGITNTGTTWIGGDAGGDVGSHPTGSFTGQASVTLANGTTHLADAVALAAKNDLILAYDDAAGRTPTIIPTELGGQTLEPGVYHSNSGTFEIAAGQTLTLHATDPDDVFVFQTDSTLVTFQGSRVVLTGQARYCRVFWKVGSSATLGVSSTFVGHIFALTSIDAQTGATVQGQLLARNGAVRLDTNTITNGICAAVTPAPATLHVIKLVINDDGRTSVAADFTMHVKASGIDVAGSPAAGAGSPGTAYTLDAGVYVVSEDANPAYTVSYSGAGIDPITGAITLAANDDVTVTITNNDVAPTATPAIHITKAANPTALPSGPGSVTYTYTVTNPGVVPLSAVIVTDDRVSPVTYVSGDRNGNGLLDPGEIWIYTATTTLSATTTNTATATGRGNQVTVTDTAVARVVVTPIRTITGGQIPRTATPWYNVLLAGVALMIVGAVGWTTKRVHA